MIDSQLGDVETLSTRTNGYVGTVTGLRFLDIGSTWIRLSWDPVSRATGYKITWHRTDGRQEMRSCFLLQLKIKLFPLGSQYFIYHIIKYSVFSTHRNWRLSDRICRCHFLHRQRVTARRRLQNISLCTDWLSWGTSCHSEHQDRSEHTQLTVEDTGATRATYIFHFIQLRVKGLGWGFDSRIDAFLVPLLETWTSRQEILIIDTKST